MHPATAIVPNPKAEFPHRLAEYADGDNPKEVFPLLLPTSKNVMACAKVQTYTTFALLSTGSLPSVKSHGLVTPRQDAVAAH